MNITSIHQYYFILTTSQLFCHQFFSTRIHERACIQNDYNFYTNIDNHVILFA